MVHHHDNTRLGVPYFDKKGKLVKYVEKPTNPPHDYAIPGLYFFNPEIFKCFSGKGAIQPSERGEYEISAPFQWLIDNGYNVEVKEYKGRWLDPGKLTDWIEANQYLIDRSAVKRIETKVDKSVKLFGRVSLGKKGAVVNSEIRGPVLIGDGVTITDSYIGPYTAIGDDCLIQGSHVENCVLMNSVKVTNVKSQIDNSLIGPESEITGNDGHKNCLEFFVGEKAKIKL
jgi:glucose-1-phosphate thymidylyltransferase